VMAWVGHREALAKMQMEMWRETLNMPPLGPFQRSGVHPIPALLSERQAAGRMRVYKAASEPAEDPEPRPGVH
jgi:hypothetical protein